MTYIKISLYYEVLDGCGFGRRETLPEKLMDIIAFDLILALVVWTAVFTVARLGYLD